MPAETPLAVETDPREKAAGIADLLQEISAFARIGSSGTSAALDADVPVDFEGFNGSVPEPSRRAVLEARIEPDGRLLIQPGTPGKYPAPSGFKTVIAGVGPDAVTYTVARHWIDDTNQSGQNSADYPFCLVNLPAWRRSPCDMRLAEWYRTEEEAVAKYAPRPPIAPEPSTCIGNFAGGVQIELSREGPSRWTMWEVRYGKRKRRTDFASPWLDHAKRTAVYWYGEPIGGWHAPGTATVPSRIAPGRATAAGHQGVAVNAK
jgi:hypothetical protein